MRHHQKNENINLLSFHKYKIFWVSHTEQSDQIRLDLQCTATTFQCLTTLLIARGFLFFPVSQSHLEHLQFDLTIKSGRSPIGNIPFPPLWY
jgi:hypothetical protein